MPDPFPPIKVPRRITKDFIKQHPEYTFVYSTAVYPNVMLGQANTAGAYDNCYGVPVRKSACKSSGYFADNAYDYWLLFIDAFLEKIPLENPIIVFPKIGNGNSRANEFAPKLLAYINEKLEEIAYPNIIWED